MDFRQISARFGFQFSRVSDNHFKKSSESMNFRHFSARLVSIFASLRVTFQEIKRKHEFCATLQQVLVSILP